MQEKIGNNPYLEEGSTLFSVFDECFIQDLQRFDTFLAVDYGIIPVFYEEKMQEPCIQPSTGCVFPSFDAGVVRKAKTMNALTCKPSAQFAYNYSINVLSKCSNIISHRSSKVHYDAMIIQVYY